MPFIEGLSRAAFLVASLALLLLAASLIGFGAYEVFRAAISPEPMAGGELLQAVGFVIIAIAVFDVSKYLLQEEVLRPRELRNAGEARRSLTKFVSTIIIAVFLEGLVTAFESGREDVTALLYPTLLLATGTLLLVGLGVFQRLTASVEVQVHEPPDDSPKT